MRDRPRQACELTGFAAAENYVKRQIAVYAADTALGEEGRARLRAEREAKEVVEQAERDRAYDERLRAEREAKEARRARAITNGILREHGYRWSNLGFQDEEEADAFGLIGPAHSHLIGADWQLFSPDGRAVSVQEAMQALARQQVTAAREWLAARGITEVIEAPIIEETPVQYLERIAHETPAQTIVRQTEEHGQSWAAYTCLMDMPHFKDDDALTALAQEEAQSWLRTDLCQQGLRTAKGVDPEEITALFVSTYTAHYQKLSKEPLHVTE